MKLPVLNIEGKELRTVEVDETVFGIDPNGAVLHQSYVRQRNNQRAGTHSTKTRGEVAGSTRKIRNQKGSGRARAGSNRSPTRVGGGIAFGPRPRSYAQDIPKKMRRLAIRSALSGKVADGQLVVIDQLAFDAPKTKEMVRIFGNVGILRSALVVTAQIDRSVLASVRNLTKTKTLPAAYLNVADMLNHQSVLITEEAIRIAEGLWGKKDGKKPEPRVVQTKANAPAKAEAPAPRRRPAASLAEPEPETLAPAEPEATTAPVEDAPKPKSAPKVKAEPKAKTMTPKPEAATKPKVPKAKADAKPKATKAVASAEDKPKRAAPAKPMATKAADEAPKPKRAPRAKKEDGNG